MDPKSTAELVRRTLDGDRDACERLVGAHLRAAYAVALGIVQRAADAEDVAQDAVVGALESLDSCREPERFSSWLFQIVRNRARNWVLRRKWVEPAEEPSQDVPAPGAADGAPTPLRQALLRALSRLTPIQREVVLLHDLQEWTHAEIASALELSDVSSRQHLFNARKALRTELGASKESTP